MDSFADLWGRKRTLKPGGKVIDERAELIQFLSKKMEREPKVVGIRAAHLTLDHLYVIQSEYKDIVNRRGLEAGRKYLWAITRTTAYGAAH